MSTPPAESDRKVRPLENDVSATDELLADVAARVRTVAGAQLRQGSRLDQIEDRLYGVENHLAGVDAKLDEILTMLRGRSPHQT